MAFEQFPDAGGLSWSGIMLLGSSVLLLVSIAFQGNSPLKGFSSWYSFNISGALAKFWLASAMIVGEQYLELGVLSRARAVHMKG